MTTKLFTPEHLEELQQQYDFISQSYGYLLENFNYFAHSYKGMVNTDEVVKQLLVEKLKIQVQLEFLIDYLK